ncbi:MAG: MotA/TolQ/ExbB proton channel family protein [Planctomycetes bacterium]|nr:MotA/TolQ/ExbB proton channel family protein [Planctomycetota bacterium]MCB9885146.1 MotA/TolQ/ExbB proton channel family protein [Planctomycetota bacterium]
MDKLMLTNLPQEPNVLGTIGEFFADGGLLMWPILGCSVVVVGIAIERYLSLRQGRLLPRVVVDAVEQVVHGHAEVIAPGILEAQAPAARVLAAGLRRRGFLLADIEKAMEDQLDKEAAALRANVRGITLMVAVAPLLGLLGTVLGIADAFAVVERTGLGKAESSEALAAGIKVALYTTIFGLGVAIPATLLAAHLQTRVRRLCGAIGDAVAPAIEPLARLGQKIAQRQQDEDTHAA